MITLAVLKEAFSALWNNRLRSFLTILGMVMGITSVIAIVSTVQGMQKDIEHLVMSLGQNTFMVTRFGVGLSWAEYLERMKRKKLTRELLPIIEQGCPDCALVGAEGYAQDDMKYGKAKMRWVRIEGQTPNVLDMRDLDVAKGRYLSWEDDRRRRKVAFLGPLVAERLFGEEDPLGKRVRMGQHEFIVIGVAESVGGMFGEDNDEFVNIPLSTLETLYPRPGNPVNLMISARSEEVRQSAMDQVRVALRSARKLDYTEDDDFTILTPDSILSFINDFTQAFRVIMISFPLLSIVVGGIVIMNIMMISVTERTREIGIRKSLGARRRNILSQFLYESLIIAIIGGVFGVFFGVKLASLALNSWMNITVTPTGLAIVTGLTISTGVGLFFGIFPAMRAARLDPVKALSYE